jgi:hypothetical protein|tara:strand:- start:409 stop:984 length:576 start_codon:yes stop_codon:yes gene_type:complete
MKSRKTTSERKSTPIVDLPNNALVFEVLHLVSKQRSKAKKVQVLKKYEHESLKTIFIWNFDNSIISVLPEGEVPYTGYDEQNTYSGTLSTKIDEQIRSMHETGSFSIGASDRQGHTTIRREFKNFYHFVKGGNDAMNNIRRETMFINILEGLHPLEAEIVCLCKDKRLTEKYNITKDVVSQAYPEIHWGDS